jgi:uncharacterized membrane protein YtjA (UPF0391 family)
VDTQFQQQLDRQPERCGIAWLLEWGVFHVAGGLIHVLLVIAVIVFLINLISGRRTV